MARTHSKGKGGGGGQKKRPRPVKRSDSKMTRWNTIDDIPMDEVDEFHASRDKILLEGNGRGSADDDDDGMDDEVFALKGVSRDSDEDEEEADYGEQYEDEDDDLEDLPPVEEKKKKKSKKSKGKKKDEDSDQEKDSEPEEEGWGRGKAAYYADNADELESDDEEAHELELQEAHRLQSKQRSGFKDSDFGLEDNLDVAAEAEQDDFAEPIPVILPTALPTEKKDILRHLEKTNPESLALARDWVDAVNELYETQARIAKIEAEDPDAMSLGMVHIHYQTLLSYCTCVAFYIYLRSSPKYAQRPALLQDHPVMKRLLTLKQSLSTLEALDFAASDSDSDEDEFGFGSMELDQNALWKFARQQGLEPNELLELLQDAKADGDMDEEDELEDDEDVIVPSKPPKKKRKTSTSTDELDEPPSKKSKSKSKSKSKTQPQPPTPVFDLVEPEFVSSSSSSSKLKPASDAVVDTFGEASQLDQADAADKSARKKSLRFHTSKIESASARRHGARNQAIGGDDDLPYRDRKKEKDAKLIKEAAKRGNEGGADLDDEEPEPSLAGSKRDRESDDDGSDSDGGDGYYELVKKQNKEKKGKKKAEYEEFHGRSRLDEEENATGPRSLTRAILKNKGLTPHRPKAVRNPRVKKRQKYEQAKKKEASRKAIYKGGLAATGGRYDGELSGISKVVKSVRLG